MNTKDIEEIVEHVMRMTVSNQFVYDTMNMEQKALFTQDIRRAVDETLTTLTQHHQAELERAVKEERERIREVATEVIKYVRYVEEQIDGEWGSCRGWQELYENGEFPEFYDKLQAFTPTTTDKK